jgi:glycosyltransferase A (GT-A) superfamily protein (DUF2064 family)
VCCGSRLWARVARALLAGAESRSGTDCPGVDADTLAMARKLLSESFDNGNDGGAGGAADI